TKKKCFAPMWQSGRAAVCGLRWFGLGFAVILSIWSLDAILPGRTYFVEGEEEARYSKRKHTVVILFFFCSWGYVPK
ncbi:hypothetical protein B0T21DRAFT_363027, partial [Apiosordaria backusii]